MSEADSSIQPNRTSCSLVWSSGEIKYTSIPRVYKNATKYLKALMKLFLAGRDSINIFIEVGEPSTNSKMVVGQLEQAMLYLLMLVSISSWSSLWSGCCSAKLGIKTLTSHLQRGQLIFCCFLLCQNLIKQSPKKTCPQLDFTSLSISQ